MAHRSASRAAGMIPSVRRGCYATPATACRFAMAMVTATPITNLVSTAAAFIQAGFVLMTVTARPIWAIAAVANAFLTGDAVTTATVQARANAALASVVISIRKIPTTKARLIPRQRKTWAVNPALNAARRNSFVSLAHAQNIPTVHAAFVLTMGNARKRARQMLIALMGIA